MVGCVQRTDFRATCYYPVMEQARLHVTERMRALMAYAKFAGPTPRMMVLEGDYWLDVACVHAAETLGWEVARVPVRMVGKMPREMLANLLQALGEFRPDFLLSVNLSGMDERGLLAGLFADLEIPWVTWFVDDPRTILMGRNTYGSDYAMALTWEQSYITYLEGCGFAEVHTMPLAVDPSVFNAEPADRWPLPPTFVGNSMVAFAQREWAWFEKRPEMAQVVHAAFNTGQVTRKNFGAGLDALLDADAISDWDAEARRHAEMVCFIEGTRRVRQETVMALHPMGLVVRGDEGWGEYGVAWEPYLNYTGELPWYYRTCAININTTSIQMPTTVNQRVFDCPAAGGFLLTDAQTVLGELFDVEREVACYRTMEECAELYGHYRKHPEERRALATRARERVLNEHTYGHRLEKIVGLLKARFI